MASIYFHCRMTSPKKDVSLQLGCKGTNLSKGAPEAVSGVYGPR
ncbi:hypothetical protein HEK131_46640 [Streptomyces seoulensis]|nr:hypothetical protein HEK131_46640 [Streptomyces seoulensis]